MLEQSTFPSWSVPWADDGVPDAAGLESVLPILESSIRVLLDTLVGWMDSYV